jgi:c-di-GMP-binding flagellar brake protein YcgR
MRKSPTDAVMSASRFPLPSPTNAKASKVRSRSSDLGGGGIRLGTDEDLPLGSVLLLRFKLPGGEREMLARGRIVLSFYNAEDRRFFHGIAFTQIDPRDQEEIVRFTAGEIERLALEGETAPD